MAEKTKIKNVHITGNIVYIEKGNFFETSRTGISIYHITSVAWAKKMIRWAFFMGLLLVNIGIVSMIVIDLFPYIMLSIFGLGLIIYCVLGARKTLIIRDDSGKEYNLPPWADESEYIRFLQTWQTLIAQPQQP